jgi:hypothetical protein
MRSTRDRTYLSVITLSELRRAWLVLATIGGETGWTEADHPTATRAHRSGDLAVGQAAICAIRCLRSVTLLLGFNQIIAIEIKAHSASTIRAAKHLRWLRDQLGDRFIAGLVLHTGPHIYPLDAQITAAPICTIWG